MNMPALDFSQLQITATADLPNTGEIADALLRATHSAGLGVFVWDIPAGRLLWNEAMYELYGLDPASFSGKASDWLALLHAEDLPRVAADVGAALSGERPYDTVFRVQAPLGGWRYLKGTAFVERDASGQAVRMAGINQDVTTTERFNAAVDAVRAGTADQVSHGYFESLVRSLAEALGVRYAFVAEVYPREQPTHARAIALCVDGKMGEPLVYALAGTPCANVVSGGFCIYPQAVQAQFPDDQLLVEMRAECYLGVPLRAADGTVLGLLEVLDNKPAEACEETRKLLELFAGRASAELERLQREAEIQRLNAELEARVAARTDDLRRTMRELEAFTYSVSHDLNPPLRAILGFGQILREDYRPHLDAAGGDYLDRTLGAAERMGRLIDDLVSLSKISLRPLGIGKVNLTELAEEIVADLQARQPRAGLVFEAAPHLIVHADPGLMRILLDCLLRNAWQFIAQVESPHISLAAQQVGERREILLRDNGCGFDPQAIDRLFAPFQNLDSQGGFTGSGTGLAIAQRIALRHHGGIRAESQPGEGACFAFWLPPAAELMALLAGDPL